VPTALRIVTWNIHKGIGGVDRKYRPERIVEVLSHHEPDLVLLQEVDEGAPRSRLHRQVDLIADGLEFGYRCFGPNVTLSRGRYGNAIVSRHPISESHNINLTVAPKKRRGALHARVKLTIDGHVRSLAVFNVHLGLAGFERKIQLKRLLANSTFRSLRAATPCILGGDFNDVWSNLGARLLENAGLRRVGGPIPGCVASAVRFTPTPRSYPRVPSTPSTLAARSNPFASPARAWRFRDRLRTTCR